MPHVSSSGGDDLGSTDEVKVFKDEGDGEDEKRSSENLTEEKSSLIDLTESEVRSTPASDAQFSESQPSHESFLPCGRSSRRVLFHCSQLAVSGKNNGPGDMSTNHR